MSRALDEAGLLSNLQVKLTDKKQEISVGIDNFHLLLDHLPPNPSFTKALTPLMTYQKSSKIVTSYTSKLLNLNPKAKPGLGIIYPTGDIGLVYPSWYPIPSLASHYGSDNDSGGTIQGRFSCRKPGAQTFPPPIMKCLHSRFPGGKIIGYDLSQIELRIGALLSGDPIMLREYAEGIDRHTQTALDIWPDADINAPDFRKTKRQGGKTLNFLVIYRGRALKYQETMMKDHGLFIPLEICQDAISRFDKRYYEFRRWQEKNIEFVKKHGYLEIVTGWSRYWGKGHSMEKAVSEICDFPIQTISAQLLQSAQFAIECEILQNNLRSYVMLQIHDALYTDVCPGEEKIIDEFMGIYLTRPPLLGIVENSLGRTVPILYEKQVY